MMGSHACVLAIAKQNSRLKSESSSQVFATICEMSSRAESYVLDLMTAFNVMVFRDKTVPIKTSEI